MAQTKAGAIKARESILKKNPNHYKEIGRGGGKSGTGEQYRKGGSKAIGFASNPERARILGAKGGALGKRPKESYKTKTLVIEAEQPKKRAWNFAPFNSFRRWRD